jgi:hypothetical protein
MHTTRSVSFAATAALLVFPALRAQGDLLYSVTSIDGTLRTVSLLTATTTSSVQIVNGSNVPAVQCNGMARDPISGQVYALVRFTGAARNLCTLNLQTGVATVIGAMADSFAGLAFRIDGTLFGVTGDGAVTPETLYTINTANAQATFVRALGNGNDGETIAFAPDLSLYHASGLGTPNANEVFERLDTFTNTLTNVPLSGYDYDELLALTSYTGGVLIGADLNDDLLSITTGGAVSWIGTLDHSFVKGLVIVPSPNTQPFLRGYGDGCALAAGPIPILFGSGVPIAGQTIGVHLRHAPLVTFGLIAVGFGSGVLPIPSPTCQVQVSPVVVASGFVTNGLGEFDFLLALPAGLSPFDLFFQTGVLDGTGFVVSNAVQMHM